MSDECEIECQNICHGGDHSKKVFFCSRICAQYIPHFILNVVDFITFFSTVSSAHWYQSFFWVCWVCFFSHLQYTAARWGAGGIPREGRCSIFWKGRCDSFSTGFVAGVSPNTHGESGDYRILTTQTLLQRKWWKNDGNNQQGWLIKGNTFLQ